MTKKNRRKMILAASLCLCALIAPAVSQAQAAPELKMPQPGVPEIFTLEGKFVRVAYNNEGYVILGYQPANRSIGGKWMLLEIGVTLLGDTPNYKLTRDALSLETPDGKTIPLATVSEQRAGGTQGLQERAKMQRDSIDYFPRTANQPCRLAFFTDLDSPGMPFDEVELSPVRACLGRIYFNVPEGIAYGQHWLNVKFQNSLVRVPFKILTKDEEKFVGKNLKDIQKQVEEAFQQKN